MTAPTPDAAASAPPLAERHAWLRFLWQGLFGGWVNSAITLAVAWLLVVIVPPMIDWMIVNATFVGSQREDCTGSGACWVYVQQRFGQLMYGLYPEAQRWRVDVAGLLLVAFVGPLFFERTPGRARLALAALVLYPPLCLVFLLGGVFGLPYVETREWGGLMLTTFMAVFGGVIAFPLGVLLALGRRSELPVIHWVSVTFIEFWRGVPIIAVIFLASVLLPLILPQGVTVDRLLRALVGLALVVAAYMAEVVRGGLQALPKGQEEAARAMGLGYWQTTGLIVLPQALRIVIPGLVNEFIALFKNTTLVLIVSLFDFLGMAQATLADPKWVGMNLEAYVFVGLVFWMICFAVSRWSLRLERRLETDRRG
jgi:general L-amino acid transport system permease protein